MSAYYQPPYSTIKEKLEIDNLELDKQIKKGELVKQGIVIKQMRRPQILRMKYITTFVLVAGTLIVGHNTNWLNTAVTIAKANESKAVAELTTVKNDASKMEHKLRTFETMFESLPKEEQTKMLTNLMSQIADMSNKVSRWEGIMIASTITETQTLYTANSLNQGLTNEIQLGSSSGIKTNPHYSLASSGTLGNYQFPTNSALYAPTSFVDKLLSVGDGAETLIQIGSGTNSSALRVCADCGKFGLHQCKSHIVGPSSPNNLTLEGLQQILDAQKPDTAKNTWIIRQQ